MKGLGEKITLNIIVFLLLQECFHSKDFLNLRYHHKRALYLAVLASHLKQSSFIESVKFSHMNGEVLRPILLLKPKGNYRNHDSCCHSLLGDCNYPFKVLLTSDKSDCQESFVKLSIQCNRASSWMLQLLVLLKSTRSCNSGKFSGK